MLQRIIFKAIKETHWRQAHQPNMDHMYEKVCGDQGTAVYHPQQLRRRQETAYANNGDFHSKHKSWDRVTWKWMKTVCWTSKLDLRSTTKSD